MALTSLGPLPPEADEAGARARLDEFIRCEIAGTPPRRRTPGPRRADLAGMWLAASAALAVAVGLWRRSLRPPTAR